MIKILITGSYNAGKTTLVKTLSKGKSMHIDRRGTTIALDHGIVQISGIKFFLFGTPGLKRFKILRRILSKGADGVLFVVDSNEPEKDDDAKKIWDEIQLLLPDVPIVIAANKQDLPTTRPPKEVLRALGLDQRIPVFPTSALEDQGLKEVLEALLKRIAASLENSLKVIKIHGEKEESISKIASSLNKNFVETRHFLRLLEWRGLITADWKKQKISLTPEAENLLVAE